MAVIDACPRFQTAVRGYDRAAVDAVIRAETDRLEQLNERIAVLEQHLAASRGAAFRVDDPQRKQSIRAAADLLSDAWDYARQVVNAEEATAELQRNHAAKIAATYLADVTAWAEAEEGRVQADVDAMLAAAHEAADHLREQADAFVENAVPMAEQLTVEATEHAEELALAAETEAHTRREAIEADLTQRQTAVHYDLQAAQRLAAQLEAESIAVTEQATRMGETALGQAQAITDDLANAVADEIALLEEESDLAMAELAEHMATLSTQITSARKSMAARPARAKAARSASSAPTASPESAAADVETTAPVPATAFASRAAPAATRTRKTTPAPAAGLKTRAAKPTTRPAPEPEPVAEAAESTPLPSARQLTPPETFSGITIGADGIPVLKL